MRFIAIGMACGRLAMGAMVGSCASPPSETLTAAADILALDTAVDVGEAAEVAGVDALDAVSDGAGTDAGSTGDVNITADSSADETSGPDADVAVDASAGPEPCYSKHLCFNGGRCWTLPDTPPGGPVTCYAKSDADCAQSGVCKTMGWCWAYQNICIAKAGPGCAGSAACKIKGQCSAGNVWCAPASNADCEQGEECATQGQCIAAKYKDDPDGNAHCFVPATYDCTKSQWCKNSGYCKFSKRLTESKGVELGFCDVQTAEGCAASKECAVNGKCSFCGWKCCAASEEDCNNSKNCEYLSECTLDKVGQECEIAPGTDCKGTQGCKEEGFCSSAITNCMVKTDADCAQSQACKKEGRCLFSDRYLRCEATVDPWPPNW